MSKSLPKSEKTEQEEILNPIYMLRETDEEKTIPATVDSTIGYSMPLSHENYSSEKLFQTNKEIPACSPQLKEEKVEKKLEPRYNISNINLNNENSAELLGSVTTSNCLGTRTSARVIQKMKQDQQTRPISPPVTAQHHQTIERENRDSNRKEERSSVLQKSTASTSRTNRPTWSNVEKNYFFDALNEFGKDFEAIGNYINTKLKRRSPLTDNTFKSKEQVRQHYYQTYHKVSKYVRFSDEIRKQVQEVYTLINYGEMRRKLQFVTDKHFMKLRYLVYHGHVTLRCKGKNIRIKTPSCKALRRLNQLDDSLEDIKLPSKIEVIVTPANMEAFGRVQTIAQNPKCRTIVPLHRKLFNFIRSFQMKWRSMEARIADEVLTHSTGTGETLFSSNHQYSVDPDICFLPKPGVTINRPLLSITECLSSVNICLNAYEERMGIKVRGFNLCMERQNVNYPATSNINSTGGSAASQTSIFSGLKRTRFDNGVEKRCLETKRIKNLIEQLPIINNHSVREDVNAANSEEETTGIISLDTDTGQQKCESSGDELNDELQELFSECIEANDGANKEEVGASNVTDNSHSKVTELPIQSASSGGVVLKTRKGVYPKSTVRPIFKPLLNEEVIQKIRGGWITATAGDITIGDLYVVLGQDSKLELNYYWLTESKNSVNKKKTSVMAASTNSSTETERQQLSLATVAHSLRDINVLTKLPEQYENSELLANLNSCSLSNKLKHLLLIANLSDRLRKRSCYNCERNAQTKQRMERELASGRVFLGSNNRCSVNESSIIGQDSSAGVFRQPAVPLRRSTIDPVKQLSTLNRQKMSKQLSVVQRLLLPSNGQSVVNSKISPSKINSIQLPINEKTTASNIFVSNSTIMSKSTITDNNCTTTYLPSMSAKETSVQTSQSPLNATKNIYTDKSESTFLSQNIEINTINTSSFNINMTKEAQERVQSYLENINQQEILKTTEMPEKEKAEHNPVQSVDNVFGDVSNASFLNGLNMISEESSNSRWLEENVNDFSLNSLLGHLDEINASRDILDPSSNLSILSESSVDYMHKFQEIQALIQAQEINNKDGS